MAKLVNFVKYFKSFYKVTTYASQGWWQQTSQKTIVPIGRMREMTLKKKIATTHFFLKMRQQNKLLHDIAYAKILMD
jgi:hypothetical protein